MIRGEAVSMAECENEGVVVVGGEGCCCFNGGYVGQQQVVDNSTLSDNSSPRTNLDHKSVWAHALEHGDVRSMAPSSKRRCLACLVSSWQTQEGRRRSIYVCIGNR